MRALQVSAFLVGVVSILGALSWLSFLDGLSVQRIVVTGNESISTLAIESRMLSETVSPALFLFSKQNTLTFPSAELEDLLSYEFPKIKTISIVRQPTQQQVEVLIEEREPYALWCGNNIEEAKCFNIDSGGFIFEDAHTPLTQNVIFKGGLEASRVDVKRLLVSPSYFEHVR